MTWDAYHRRKDVLREIFAMADRHPDRALSAVLDAVDPHRLVLEDETAALFEIQMAWFQRLSGHIDRLTVEGADTPPLVAVAAWTASASELPGARALLDAHSDSTDLATAFAKERDFIAASAGVPSNDPNLGGHGERIIAAARVDAAAQPILQPATEALQDDQRQGLMARLRGVIAA